MKLNKNQKELNIRVAASDLFSALEEIIFITNEGLGGIRRETAREKFMLAMVELFKSFKGYTPSL